MGFEVERNGAIGTDPQGGRADAAVKGWLPLKPHPLVTLPLPPSNLWIPGLSGPLMMRPSVQWSEDPLYASLAAVYAPATVDLEDLSWHFAREAGGAL